MAYLALIHPWPNHYEGSVFRRRYFGITVSAEAIIITYRNGGGVAFFQAGSGGFLSQQFRKLMVARRNQCFGDGGNLFLMQKRGMHF